MQGRLSVSFRDFPHSKALEANIREKAAKLEQFFDGIISCRVVIEAPHRSHRQGRLYHARIFISVPGQTIISGKDSALHHSHEDPYVAVRDAFDNARRQLQDYARRMPHVMRAHLLNHERPPQGRVVRLHYGDGEYGFLQTEDAREIYFNRNSVLNDNFDNLKVGDVVRFQEETGEDGPQASTVELLKAAA